MIKVDKKIFRITYILFIIAWTYGDIKFNRNDDFKYIVVLFSVAVGMIPIIQNRNKYQFDTYLLKKISLITIVFLIFTIYSAVLYLPGILKYAAKTFLAILIPAVYIFEIVNLEDNLEDTEFYFDVMYYCSIFSFLYRYRSSLTLSNIMSISFNDSYSPFESDFAMYFTLLFVYYIVKKRYIKSIVSILISFLGFKRLDVIYVFGILIISFFVKNQKTPKPLLRIAKIIFILSPILLTLLTSENFVNWFDAHNEKSFNDFTMGRLWQITEIMAIDQPLIGIGSIKNYFVTHGYKLVDPHCDILRITLETTYLGLVVAVNNFFDLSRKSIYNYFTMLFIFMLMFSSTCMDGFMNWFMVYFLCETLTGEDYVGETKRKI